MEQEPKPDNPYEGMTMEELYGVVRDLQMAQREINYHTSLVQALLVKGYTEGLRGIS